MEYLHCLVIVCSQRQRFNMIYIGIGRRFEENIYLEHVLFNIWFYSFSHISNSDFCHSILQYELFQPRKCGFLSSAVSSHDRWSKIRNISGNEICTCNAERDKYQKWNVKFSEKDFPIGSMYIHIISTASLCKWCCRDIWISSNLWSMQNSTKSCWRSSISVPDRKVGTIVVWIYVVESDTSICHSY